METGSRGMESVEAAVDDKLFTFKFAKFGTSNDVPFLSGFGIEVGRGDIGGTDFQSIHLCKEETQMNGLHANDASIGLFGVNWSTAAIGYKACLVMTIKLACKHNEIGDSRIIFPQFLSWFETSKSLVLIDAFEFLGNGVLPKCVSICLVEFQSMLHIAWDINTKHELDAIDACLVGMYH